MNDDKNFILIETSPTAPSHCIKIVRSYIGERRANEDRELLEQMLPDRAFNVITISHIDD